MDPKATLQRIRELVDTIYAMEHDDLCASDMARDLAEHVNALDSWMERKGASPWSSR